MPHLKSGRSRCDSSQANALVCSRPRSSPRSCLYGSRSASEREPACGTTAEGIARTPSVQVGGAVQTVGSRPGQAVDVDRWRMIVQDGAAVRRQGSPSLRAVSDDMILAAAMIESCTSVDPGRNGDRPLVLRRCPRRGGHQLAIPLRKGPCGYLEQTGFELVNTLGSRRIEGCHISSIVLHGDVTYVPAIHRR